ncbi:MAG: murein biosynthesis integral membrane protein MurJ [Candidatus Omnitrophica bacterium]|nr:murein biosynthesis integral membrane protein MurJ [Candidatus Omnitrophota bacterium]
MSTGKSPQDNSNRAVFKSASIISLATLISRILGFIRDVVIARLFGVYIYAQAFVIAFRIPNLLRDFVGEGATNAAVVPVMSEYELKHTRQEYWELAGVFLNILLVVLSAITLLGILLSPLLVRLIAPGFIADPHKLAVTIKLNRIIFPYILLIGLSAYSMGILNSLKHFSIPAFAPCLLNISIIVFALLYGEGIKGLATGILVGGSLQLLVQVPMLYRKGFRFNPACGLKHPGARSIMALMLPRVFSSCIYQLNNFADSIFGSLAFIVGEGGVAILYFAYRIIQFPIGIFSNALSQALLPTLSVQALEEDRKNFTLSASFGLRAVFFTLLPASVCFMVLSRQIISSLFFGGRFDIYSADKTSEVLFFYSIGLFAYGSVKVLQSCFFALKDTVTPAKVSFFAFIINIALNCVLMFPMKISGLALATSLSGLSSFLILLFILKKRISGFKLPPLFNSFLRIFLASLLTGAVVHTVAKTFFISAGTLNKFMNLGLSIFTACLSYMCFCLILRVPEIRELKQWLFKRSSTGPSE